MVKFKYFIALLSVIFMGCFAVINTAQAAPRDIKTKISTDRSDLYTGGSFNLYIEISSPRKLNKTDLKYSPLSNNFTVGNVGFESSDGTGINTYRWKLPLICNKSGIVKVPSLAVGSNLSTPAFELNIKKPEGIRAKKIVKTQLRNNHLVQGQLAMYRVEIDMLPNVKIDTVSQPYSQNATIELLTERTISRASSDKSFVYKTRIQEYKIIFNKAGQNIIKSPVVSGVLRDQNNKGFMESAKDITISVGENKSQAVVSENMSIIVKWMPEDNEIAVGQPISRTITIRGTNNSLSQLPVMKLPQLEGFDSYEDYPIESEKLMKNKQLISTKVVKQVFVPKKNHTTFSIPSIQIEWKNPNDGSIHAADIPGAKYSIDGFSFNDYIPSDPKYAYWIASSIIVLVLLIVFSYFSVIWYRERYGIYDWIHTQVDHVKYWHEFAKNWSNMDPFQSRRALLEWSQKRWPDYTIVGLTDIPFYSSAKAEIDQLSEACWSANHVQWKGNALYKQISKNKNYTRPKAKHGINPFGLNGEIYETVKQKMK